MFTNEMEVNKTGDQGKNEKCNEIKWNKWEQPYTDC